MYICILQLLCEQKLNTYNFLIFFITKLPVFTILSLEISKTENRRLSPQRNILAMENQGKQCKYW